MDEFTAVLRARELTVAVNPTTIPVAVEAYAAKVGAIIRVETDLGQDEAGWSFERGGKYYICINGKDQEERRRFTICHEIAHIVLCLPSDHKALPWWSYAKRSADEILCDVFAAELLLPYRIFKPAAEKEEYVSGRWVIWLPVSWHLLRRPAPDLRRLSALRAPLRFQSRVK